MLERFRSKMAGMIQPKSLELEGVEQDFVMTSARGSFVRSGRSEIQLLKAFNEHPTLHAVVHKIAENFAAITWTIGVERNIRGDVVRSKIKRVRNLDRRNRLTDRKKAAGEFEELENHPLLDLFEYGNPVLDGHAVFQLSQEYMDLNGNTFIAVSKSSMGLPTALWPTPSPWVKEVPTPDRPFYEVLVNGANVKFAPDEMIWLKDPNPLNPYGKGTSPAGSLANELDTDEYAAQFIQAFFANNAMPAAIIGFPGAKTESVAAIKEQWENEHRGPRKAHRLKFVNKDVKSAILTSQFKDRDVVALREFLRDEVLHQFGMPPEIMGILENSNRATIEAAETIFARFLLIPRAERFRIGLQKQLVDLIDPNLILGYDSPVPEDHTRRLTTMEKASHHFTRQQWQNAAGNDVEIDDDVYMVPSALVPESVDGEEEPPDTDDGEAVGAAKDNQVIDPSAALNGAQVTALLSVIAQVAQGTLPKSTAISVIDAAFPIPVARIEEMLADIVAGSLEPTEAAVRALLGPTKTHKAVTPTEIDFLLRDLDPQRLVDSTKAVMDDNLEAWGNRTLEELGTQISFNMVNPLVLEHLREYEFNMELANETTKKQLRKALIAGVEAGEGLVELSKRVAIVFDSVRDSRSDLMAWTEVNRSSNFGNFHAMSVSGVVDYRDWLNAGDDRVRSSHNHSLSVKITDPFSFASAAGGTTTGMYPGNMDVQAENFRCRCTTVANFQIENAIQNNWEKAFGNAAIAKELALKDIASETEGHRAPWRKEYETAVGKGFDEQEKDILRALAALTP